MPIDWFTVAAQAVNFLILVWLLKRFLYKPILDAIEQREKGIAGQLAQAEAKKAAAEKDRNDLQGKNEAFDRQRESLLKKAVDEAGAERGRLLDEARRDADALRSKRQDSLRDEQRNLSQEIACRTQQQVFAVARRALADLADASLEQRMAEMFVRRLRALTSPAKEEFAAAFKSSNQPPRVRSAFDLPPEERSEIERAIQETFATQTHVQFATSPDLIGGIELTAGGRKVAWSIADYLVTLEKSVGELLQADAKPAPEAIAKPGPTAEAATKANGKTNHDAKPVAAAQEANH